MGSWKASENELSSLPLSQPSTALKSAVWTPEEVRVSGVPFTHCGYARTYPPVGPKRSVLIRAGSCPSRTSPPDTCSTKPVGPQT
jgi:hypothetical protein